MAQADNLIFFHVLLTYFHLVITIKDKNSSYFTHPFIFWDSQSEAEHIFSVNVPFLINLLEWYLIQEDALPILKISSMNQANFIFVLLPRKSIMFAF